jgi:tetratricopeptide (TPR) repeat protein
MEQPKAPPRIVLFFDTHEAFWGQQRQIRGDLFFQRDEWLRCLLAELELAAGIVTVVAGREKPRWAEARKQRIPSEYLDSQSVGHLSVADARNYLQRAGIPDAALTEALITYSSVALGQVQPFLLALCVDVVEKAQEHGVSLTPADFKTAAEAEEKPKELIERLLKYVDENVADAVHALSAARAFDRELFFQLGDALRFQVTDALFRVLTRFSFVWQDERRGENWYRIHDLLRRLNYEGGNEITHNAHEVLEQCYRERGNVAEAIYHANRLDWERGVEEWGEVFDKALQQSRYQQCRTLLEVRLELLIQSDFQLGNVSKSEGDYLAQLALYAEAKQEYLEAISAYERELESAPNDTATHNSKGNALSNLGKLQTQLAQHCEALQSYQDAISTYNSALSLAPDYRYALNNKGIALDNLGNLQTQLTQYSEALHSYTEAVAAYNSALSLVPNYIDALNNKGCVLHSLGDLQTQLAQYSEALQSYQDAIATYNSTLSLDPHYVYALNNKGSALQSLGDLQTKLSQDSEALQSYQDAIAAYSSALTLAPYYIYARNNKGVALHSLGDLQAKLSQNSEALVSYRDAIATYNSAFSLAPNYIDALNNKGEALKSLGDLQTKLSQDSDALQSYQDAISAYNIALTLAPDYITVLNNKGRALKSLGDLQAESFQKQDTLKSWQAALAAFTRSLEIAPGDREIRNQRERLQAHLDSLGENTPSD